MRRDLKRLADETFDVVIVGGGVYGLVTAWDAAARGWSVALVEKGDFGHASSSATLKLVHGGLRYLQHLDFRRMRVSIGERRRMLHMAPHLVRPLAFVVPCYGHGVRGPEAMRAALLANDLISWDRNRGQDPARLLPAGRILSRAETIAKLPDHPRDNLTGGSVFYDAQMYNSERLSLAFGLSAAAHGAALANYAEAVGFDAPDGRIRAVRVRDAAGGGGTFDVRGRLFLNMTGPWSDITAQLVRTATPNRRLLRSKGIQIVTRPLGPPGFAFSLESRQRDTTALIKRGGRMYFVTPWRGRSIVGTTDVLYEDDPDRFSFTEKDVDDFIGELNEIHPSATLERKDVTWWVGGLRPVGDADTDPAVAKASHRYQVLDHARHGGPENLVSVVGVKYTICRHVAAQVLDLVAPRLPAARPCQTDRARAMGGEIDDWASFEADAIRTAPFPEPVARHLATSYGRDMALILALVRDAPDLGCTVAGSTEVLRAEIVHAARGEMALTLADAVLRRTDLGAAGHPGASALEECARLMAAELGWDVARSRDEIAKTDSMYRLKA